MTDDHCTSPQWIHEAGVYVLGASTPADQAGFERHLPTCRPCRDAVRELRDIPRLLAAAYCGRYRTAMPGAERAELRARLRAAVRWRQDRTDRWASADVTRLWRDAALLRELGPALAGLFDEARPTVVLGPESRGCLIGPLVAAHLGIGFVEVRKNRAAATASDAWVRRTTPPDYKDRHLELGFPRALVGPQDRVLVTDDWIETGSQARTMRQLVDVVHASWVGVACVVDAMTDPRLRRDLTVRSLLHVRDIE